MEPVIVVQPGNPHDIQGLEALINPEINLLLTDRTYSTTGHLVTRMYEKLGLLDELEENITARLRCPCTAANALTLETADAAIVWNVVAGLRKDKLDIIEIAPDHRLKQGVDVVTSATFGQVDMSVTKVSVALLKYSQNPDAARAFAVYASSSRCAPIWKEFGFLSPSSEKW